ncbi:MAG: cytochrome P450 [Caulobacteraceae bacterium]
MSDAPVLRPAPTGAAARLAALAMEHVDAAFAAARAVWPIPRLGAAALVTRYDDVREALLADDCFAAPYGPKLDVIMGGEAFFLGMGDTPAYRRDTAAMREVVRAGDIAPRLTGSVARAAAAVVDGAPGRIEVVDALARKVTFEVLCDYFGVRDPPDADMRVVATRLFEFQFADPTNDPALRRDVDVMAPLLRRHLDATIAARRRVGSAIDDVLGRCLDRAASGAPGFSDVEIRTGLIGLIVGGLPQPPMVVPQALDQLLRRPDALAGAAAAAAADDDALLAGHVFEALRFDPLAPALMRAVVRDRTIAAGTGRATALKAGSSLLVSTRSAMRDPRRIRDPGHFDPRRPAHDYLHFGYGLHTCFAMAINRAVLPLMLKPLLLRPGLRRAPGAAGRLSKRGAFADSLTVDWDV